MSSENLSEFVKIGAAWKNTDRSGRVFLSTDIFLAGRRVVLFKNLYKEQENQPDFQVFLSPLPEEKRGEGTGRRGIEAADDIELFSPEPAPPSQPPANRQQPPARPATRQPYQPPRVADVGGINAFLGNPGAGRGRRVDPTGTPETEELSDPFAE